MRWVYFLVAFVLQLFLLTTGPNNIIEFFTSGCLLLVGLILLTFRSRKQKLIAVTSIGFILGFGIGYLLSNYQQSFRKTNVEKIVVALEQHYKSFGNYPVSLEKLKDGFMDEIPTSKWGVKKIPFTYACGQDQASYSVSFQSGFTTGWTYGKGVGWQFYD